MRYGKLVDEAFKKFGLHWDGSALEEYFRRVNSPRFIKDGLFTVEREHLLQSITEVQAFVAWVHAELKKLGPKFPTARAD